MRFLKKIWRPIFAILFLAILVKKGPIKLEQFQLILGQPKILALGFILFLLQSIFFAYRWKIFVDRFSFLEFKTAFKLTLIGQFFSFFIPGGVGGDVVKALELAKEHVASRSEALATVIADRAIGLFYMILFSSLFLAAEYLLAPSALMTHYLLVSWLLLAGVFFGLLLSPYVINETDRLLQGRRLKVISFLNKILSTFALTFQTFRNLKLMFKNFVLCLLIQLLSICFIFYVVKSLNVEPPGFFIFFSLCCFGFLAASIPLTPAGIGVGQAAFYFLFESYGKQVAEASVTAVSILQLFQLFFALFGGFFFSFRTQQQPKKVA